MLIKIESPHNLIKKINMNESYCNACTHNYRDKYGLNRHKLTKKHILLTQRPTEEELNKIKQYPKLAELPTRKELQKIKLIDIKQ